MYMNSQRKFWRLEYAPWFDALHRFAPARAMMARDAPSLFTRACRVQYKFIQVGTPVINDATNQRARFTAHAVGC